MKRILFSLTCLVLLAGLIAANVSAMAEDPQLAFTLESVSPASPYPGQKVTVKVKYPGDSDASQAEKVVNYTIVTNTQAGSAEARCPGECAFRLSSDGDSEFSFFAPVQEGTYSLTANLKVENEQASQKLEIGSLVVETALPASVAQLFAGLGLFAAVMAIMALGTEVVIELSKFFLGLKAKVTAIEAFEELKKELPGQLNQLGVDNKTIQKLDGIFEGMHATLQPFALLDNAVAQISGGMFADAFRTLQEMAKLDLTAPDVTTRFARLKEEARTAVQHGLILLSQKLPLQREVIQEIQASSLRMIDGIQLTDIQAAAKNFFVALQQAICDHEPEWTKQWLLTHANDLVSYDKNYLINLADENIFGPIQELGFEQSCVDELRKKFTNNMDTIANFLIKNANTYTESIKNLLVAVENQRNAYQSPARKVWRRLRRSSLPIRAAALIAGIGFGLIRWIFTWNVPPAPGSLLNWAAALIWGVIVGVGFWLFAFITQTYFTDPSQVPQKLPKAPQEDLEIPPFDTLGYFLRFVVERGFNFLMGRKSSMKDALTYGDIDQEITDQIDNVRPDTLAKTLLEREEKHQDEEVSRVRMIRILSLIIGTYLAYHLQIDAAAYLNYAIPGIERQINVVNLSQLWSALPRNLTVGVILTGLAASAGSKFWRDLLSRLQSTRDQAEETARLVRSIKGTITDVTGSRIG